MHIEVTGSRQLRFDDGAPVRAASAIAPFGDGWLIAQDDATHAAWWRAPATVRVRLFPPVEGHEHFSEAAGTKHLKPDLEAACEVAVGRAPGVLLLGSGSTPARMRGALALLERGAVRVLTADLTPLYDATAAAIGVDVSQLNIEGSCRHGDRLRLFNRGNRQAGLLSASVDVGLEPLVATMAGERPAHRIPVGWPRSYALGDVGGVGLAITDAVTLADGRVLVSTAAEDTPNAVDDGPVVAAGLALLDGGTVAASGLFRHGAEPPHKVEGLALRQTGSDALALLAVVDADDARSASTALDVLVHSQPSASTG